MTPNGHFLAVSLSVFGALGDASRPFFNHLLTQLAYQSNAPFSEVAAHFWIAQSVLIQRLKAQTLYRALLSSAPGPPNPLTFARSTLLLT